VRRCCERQRSSRRRMRLRSRNRKTGFWGCWRAKRDGRAASCTTTGSLTTSRRRAASKTRSRTPISQSSSSSPTTLFSRQTLTFHRGAASGRWARSENPKSNRVARVQLALYRKILRIVDRGRDVARSLQLC